MIHILNLFLLVILTFNLSFCYEKLKLFKCGADDEKFEPLKPIKTELINKNDISYKRRLDSDGYKSFNIYLDTKNVELDIRRNSLDAYRDLLINSMKKAVEALQSLLRVKPMELNSFFDDEGIKTGLKIEAWNDSIIGNKATMKGVTMNSLDIDLIIFGKIETLGEQTLASASGRAFTNEGQPYIGLVKINNEVDYSKEKSAEYFQAIVLHEFTHILGFSISHFYNYYGNVFTRTDNFGVMRTYINSAKVLEVARKYYNCPEIDGVELEESGGEGTAGSHWEARILLGDYMNGYAYTEEMVVSEFTLALLEDSGYYKANYYNGGLMRYGKNKGCEFVFGQCVDKETQKINPLFYNEFFDTINYENANMDPSCSAGRQSRTYNAFWSYDEIPTEYQYFGSSSTGGYSPADFCPTPSKYYSEEEKANFAGHCSIKGSGEYGSKIIYSSTFISSLSKNLLAVTGEVFSDHSFCFLSSLTKNNIQISNVYSSVVRAVCLEMFCSSKSLTVKIHDNYVVCPRAGGKIIVDSYDGYLLCPDYNLMCSGTVICNDIFDCIDKKSETKEESYTNDYTPKTSQNIEQANEEDPDEEYNYELSDDGICPKFCSHCKKANKCYKCKQDYGLEGIISENKIICTNLSELVDMYYIDENNVHYKCIQNCEICTNVTGCDKCLRGYALINEQCILPSNIISNCHEYDINETCIKCNNGYAFKENNKTLCIQKSFFEEYYTTDGGVNYYPCSEKNMNCSKCYYDSDNDAVKCKKCKNDLVLVNEGDGKCLKKEEIEINSKYLFINSSYVDLCENIIENCTECENVRKCKKCKDNFYFNNYDQKCKENEINDENVIPDTKDDSSTPIAEDNMIFYSAINIIYLQILGFFLMF